MANGSGDVTSATCAEPSPIGEKELRERLGAARVAVLGCGGLGSNIAAMLLRSGVRRLILVDDDAVEVSNLNRQLFFHDQLGRRKVDALAETLLRIDPLAELDTRDERITEAALAGLVAGADLVIEAVDDVGTKAIIVGTCTRDMPDVPLVAASGLAGYDSANLIVTEQLADNVWLTGDLSSDVRDGQALLASRVMVAAAHEAHAAIRLLLGLPGA